jgi:5'-phosphate synthase pdxT subunit
MGEPFKGVFIRAPAVSEVGAGVQVMARFDSKVVAVRQGNIMGTAFHPELADDLRVHKQLVKMAVDHRNRAA